MPQQIHKNTTQENQQKGTASHYIKTSWSDIQKIGLHEKVIAWPQNHIQFGARQASLGRVLHMQTATQLKKPSLLQEWVGSELMIDRCQSYKYVLIIFHYKMFV